MSLELTPEHRQFIAEEVRLGHFPSEQAVLNAAIERMRLDPAPDLDEETLDAIDRAEERLARGEGLDWETVRADLRKRYIDR